MGLGAWQATCSGVGLARNDETKFQNGFEVELSLWRKSNSPGPSVVPAAKLCRHTRVSEDPHTHTHTHSNSTGQSDEGTLAYL